MLESLLKGDGSIHDLNLEGAFSKPALYRPRERYEALKATPLYDAKREQWNTSLFKEQNLKITYRFSDTQLLGVLVEAQFDMKAAQKLYAALKSTSLYDAEHRQWNSFISNDQVLLDWQRFSDNQLAGILAEAQFDLNNAKVLYKELQTSALYDPRLGHWRFAMTEEQRLYDPSRTANSQLLGLLVEIQFDPNAAYTAYERLKTTPLYDHELSQWNLSLTVAEKPCTDRHSYDQLLGVLLESHFNPAKAHELYGKLLTTPLYDPQLNQWNDGMSEEQELTATSRYAHTHLLAILVEAKLLATLPKPLTREIPPLPIIKDW